MSFVIDKTVTDKGLKKRSFRSLLGTIVTPDKGPCSYLNAPYFIMLLSQVSREKLASDQAVQNKEKIYLNLIYFSTTKRLYIVNNYFPLRERHYRTFIPQHAQFNF